MKDTADIALCNLPSDTLLECVCGQVGEVCIHYLTQ